MSSWGSGVVASAAAGASAMLLVAACGSFGAQDAPQGDSGAPDGGAGEAGPPGACGDPLGTLAVYADPGAEVTSVAADSSALWFSVDTAIYRKPEVGAATIVQSGAPGFGAGPIALTQAHAVWIAGASSSPRKIYFTTSDGAAAPMAFRSYAQRTLVTSSTDVAFYGSAYGVAVAPVGVVDLGNTTLAVNTNPNVTSPTTPLAVAIGGATVAFVGPRTPGSGNSVLVGGTAENGGPPKAILAETAPTANAIAVSVDGTRVYWTQSTGELMTSGSGGTDAAQSVLDKPLSGPHALLLDASWLYILTDSELVRVHPDGTCLTTTMAGSASHVAVGGRYVYVASGTKILRATK